MTKKQQPDKLSTYQTWKARLDAAAKEFEPWEQRSDKIIKRYRDERPSIERGQHRNAAVGGPNRGKPSGKRLE